MNPERPARSPSDLTAEAAFKDWVRRLVKGAAELEALDGGLHVGGAGEGARGADGLRGQGLESGADRHIFQRCGRKINTHVSPAGVLIHATGELLDIARFGAQTID